MSYLQDSKPVTLFELGKMRAEGRKIVMLTGYDASFAALLEALRVDVIPDRRLPQATCCRGQKTTLPVTLGADGLSHRVRGAAAAPAAHRHRHALRQLRREPVQAMRNAARLMAAGAHMVKLEGGAFMAETVRFLVERGVPVCAHIGLTPRPCISSAATASRAAATPAPPP